MQPLIAVDWGTSSLRLALLGADGAVLGEQASAQGILAVPEGQFASVLIAHCAQWERAGATFALMSGMIGSRQGWQEAAYCFCPASFTDIAANLAWIEGGAGGLKVAIVPGICQDDQAVPDVMRGEETQVLGALDLLGLADANVVLPGTHSKWVQVRSRRIEGFSTFMTGEFYALLRQHSILARTLPEDDGTLDEGAFLQGVAYARQAANLLHSAFSARTLALFGRLAASALPSYLSGLVIGEELRSQSPDGRGGPVILIGATELTRRYELALQSLGIAVRRVGAEATWRGLWAIAQTLKAHP